MFCPLFMHILYSHAQLKWRVIFQGNPCYPNLLSSHTRLSLFGCVKCSVICVKCCVLIHGSLFSNARQNLKCFLWKPDPLHILRVINRQLQILAVRYDQFHLDLPCLLLHIFFLKCNWNEWLVSTNNGNSKQPRRQKKKRLNVNALSKSRWVSSFFCPREEVETLSGKKMRPSQRFLQYRKTKTLKKKNESTDIFKKHIHIRHSLMFYSYFHKGIAIVSTFKVKLVEHSCPKIEGITKEPTNTHKS